MRATPRSAPNGPQKVVDAVVKAHLYAAANKEEIARLISRDGKAYLPAPADVVVKSVTDYGPAYEKSGAIRHPDWGVGRIDFQPWPYPSATKLIVEAMGRTIVEGDTTFLNGLDPKFVADDLVDYRFVKSSMERLAPGGAERFTREELLKL